MNTKIDLSVNIAGIKMQNPVMPASGTFGYGEEYSKLLDISKLGAVVTKTTTRESREGNPQPRLLEVPAGLINSIGLANPGIEEVITKKLPFLGGFGVPVIVSIGGETMEDYQYLAERLSEVEEIVGLEINISCPNVEKGGMAFGQDPEIAGRLIEKIRGVTFLPLIVKLTPNVTDIAVIAQKAVEAGADAVSLINTLKAKAKISSRIHKGKWITGGLSGPCIKPIALEKISEIKEAGLKIPLIGMGGIMTVEDALEFFEAGVQAVAIGTATFRNPRTMEEVIEGLEKYLKAQKLSSMTELQEKPKRR